MKKEIFTFDIYTILINVTIININGISEKPTARKKRFPLDLGAIQKVLNKAPMLQGKLMRKCAFDDSLNIQRSVPIKICNTN